jgi:hypothetical protein
MLPAMAAASKSKPQFAQNLKAPTQAVPHFGQGCPAISTPSGHPIANAGRDDRRAMLLATRQPRQAMGLGVAAAVVDQRIARAPDAMVTRLQASPDEFLLHRHRHRREHLGWIRRDLERA